MSSKKDNRNRDNNRRTQEHRERNDLKEPEISDDEDVIDLCDDHDYQVLSAVFETDSGRNVAEILSRLQKDVHLLAVSVHQLIQLSLASQNARNNQEESDEDNLSESDDEVKEKTDEKEN